MTSFHAPGSGAPSRLLGIFKSWLQDRSSETRPSPEDFSIEAAGRIALEHGSARILVADDNPVNLMVISALLESRGLVAWQAADGAEAVALACELPFDLILMDLQMPVLDGLGATLAIRRFEALSSRPGVPVVAYSSLSPKAGVLATHGLNGILNKPCEHQELEDCLVRWCPTYRTAPALRKAVYDNGAWQAASRHPRARPASTR